MRTATKEEVLMYLDLMDVPFSFVAEDLVFIFMYVYDVCAMCVCRSVCLQSPKGSI